jgi:hypothetical protein
MTMANPERTMKIDETQFTRKRLMITTRLPNFSVADPETPWVLLEPEDGSGPAVAMLGPDSPQSRADAARMMRLWNDALTGKTEFRTISLFRPGSDRRSDFAKMALDRFLENQKAAVAGMRSSTTMLILAPHTGKSNSLLGRLTDEECGELMAWSKNQPREPNGSVNLMKWPGWIEAFPRLAKKEQARA